MRSHLGESRAQVERWSVGEQKLRVRSVTTGCALALPTSILEGLDNVAILVGESLKTDLRIRFCINRLMS